MDLLAPSAAAAIFGGDDATLAGYVERTLGDTADDYDLGGVEADLRALIDDALPAGATLEGEALVGDGSVILEDALGAIGWIDVWTVAFAHDMNGPGA